VGARVSVVIPTLNEAANLPHVFARLPTGLHEVIVVDGHSPDDTVKVAREVRPHILLARLMGGDFADDSWLIPGSSIGAPSVRHLEQDR
jgi:GT2 family glycosyltransferase